MTEPNEGLDQTFEPCNDPTLKADDKGIHELGDGRVAWFGETTEGAQRPMLNVFHRDGETIRHFWGSELLYAPVDPGQDPRHVGTLEPVWNLFDLTPEGRPLDWDEQLSYP